MNKEQFKLMLKDNSYIQWLYEFMRNYQSIDDLYFIKNNRLSNNDKYMIESISFFIGELYNYSSKQSNITNYKTQFCVQYKDVYFHFIYDGECFICNKRTNPLKTLNTINYEEFIKQFNQKELPDLESIINRTLNNSVEFYRRIASKLTSEERTLVLNILENKSCLTCTNPSCNISYEEKGVLNGMHKLQEHSCLRWNNEEIIGKSIILRKTNVQELKRGL